MYIESEELSPEAEWEELAEAVFEFLNLDLSKSRSFKTYRSKLNL